MLTQRCYSCYFTLTAFNWQNTMWLLLWSSHKKRYVSACFNSGSVLSIAWSNRAVLLKHYSLWLSSSLSHPMLLDSSILHKNLFPWLRSDTENLKLHTNFTALACFKLLVPLAHKTLLVTLYVCDCGVQFLQQLDWCQIILPRRVLKFSRDAETGNWAVGMDLLCTYWRTTRC